MTCSVNQPQNLNFLSPIKFQFSVDKIPGVNFFCQSVSMPNVTIGQSDVGTPFIKLPLPGDHIDYSELLITFLIDENMSNYIEMYNWMRGLAFPEAFTEYAGLAGESATGRVISDASLFIYSSANNPNVQIKFINMWPNTMSDINFDTRNNDVEYVECTTSFAFERYDVIKL